MNSYETIDTENFKAILRKLTLTPDSFNEQDTEAAFDLLLKGNATDSQIGAFLTSLKLNEVDKKPVIIKSCVSILRKNALEITFKNDSKPYRDSLVDIVGTGGDGHDTFNVSTASAIIASSAGAKVIKHGNRSSTSKSGSSDFLTALKINLDKLTPKNVPIILEKTNFCFLFASLYHPSWKTVSKTRKELGFPTIFNFLGPLCNPGLPGRMVVGVYSKEFGPIMAETLSLLGIVKGLVVHGDEGLDEISPERDTHTWLICDGKVTYSIITPEDFGFERTPLSQVKGGSAEENAELFKKVLAGEYKEGPILDFILINTSAVLFVSGIADNFKHGVDLASAAIAEGKSKTQLENCLNLIQNI